MTLRPLGLDDLAFYRRIYTEPRMWTELGGVPEVDFPAKLERDVASMEADRHWVLVIVAEDGTAAGTVSLWDHEWEGETIDEIGWMVLPEHQGRGLASAGVAEALRRADETARWRVVHAFPATTNAPSNALCRRHGFALRGPIDFTYRERTLRVNHWVRRRHEVFLRALYDAFNRRDVDAVLAAMHPDVDWPNAFEGGRVRGREEVRAYWTRQFAQVDPRVEPLWFEDRGDGRIAVAVHQVVRALDGSLLADREVTHLYELRDGLIVHMDVSDGPG